MRTLFLQIFPAFLSLLLTCSTYGQTVTNGSINGTAPGNSQFQFVPNWSACPIVLGWNNTPDVCDMTFPSYNGQTTVTPVPSPDGGTWVGLANGVNPIEDECIIGNITGLTPGNSYQLKFDGACFGVGPGNYANGNLPQLEVTIGGVVLDTIAIPMTASTWFPYCIPFTANAAAITFVVHNIIGGGYAGLDGFAISTGANGSINIGNDTVLCAGQNLLLNATSPGSTYQWQDGSTSPTFNVTQAGTYWVTVTGGCSVATDTITVQFGQTNVTVNLPNDTSLCPGDNILLNATTQGGTYQWQDNSTNATFNVTQAGTYWVTVTAGCGSDTDSITVQFGPSIPGFGLPANTSICPGDTINLDVTNANVTYLWQDGSTGPTFDISQPGTYWVELSNSCGSLADTIVVVPGTGPLFNLGPDQALCPGDESSFVIEPNTTQNFAQWIWSDGSTGSSITVTDTGTYWLMVTGINGCQSTAYVTVKMVCPPTLFIPNAFTPNDDPNNNLFMAYGTNIRGFRMDIFNRWGEKLYTIPNIGSGWDGVHNGTLAPIGHYVYRVTYVDYNTTEEHSLIGSFSLIR